MTELTLAPAPAPATTPAAPTPSTEAPANNCYAPHQFEDERDGERDDGGKKEGSWQHHGQVQNTYLARPEAMLNHYYSSIAGTCKVMVRLTGRVSPERRVRLRCWRYR